MKKKIAGSLLLTFAVLVLSGCGSKDADKNNAGNSQKNEAAQKKDEGLCGIFTKDSVASITGLDIASTDVQSGDGASNSSCRYFISTKRYAPVLSIGQYKGSAAAEKKKYEDAKTFKGWKTEENKQITMNNFIAYNEAGQINDIFLIRNNDEYYRLSLYSLNIVKNDKMIELALKVAQKINGGK